ncbi:regulator of chromosome condensation 1/beta-lactamase-inhibitor protein II [Protomyces lactucae-debilis]|uniref:Regulator of chromosome condensation 1/beta-lactamase-inhibitor protein II n=1 Tax=Protomyces lactucae-debilis TaxID=2754530 RepID=A0A1Y2FLB7_PROLT|nr:regulator of chromosome condensation 1/beta-lactamase-inhibitor protein II [Protomyces lactucae-debilis]ORY84792.1 regulator of chromosome condensation 1/beta-lactamase-inhibitor protein II [Protomyces lactucae-debilis]
MAPARATKRKAPSPVLSPSAARKADRAALLAASAKGHRKRDSVASSRSFASAPALNAPPAAIESKALLDVYVFGTGSMCELGLGPDAKNKTVKRPRLNPFLAQEEVIDIAVGGMHAAALLKNGKIMTWGVNDQGALGRDTSWDGGLVDADMADDSDSEADQLNPKESTPTVVEHAQTFVKLAASDSLTVAIDADGHLWAWGTFRCSDGILGFDAHAKVAARPQRLVLRETFTDLACGTDHVLALSTSGKVFAWGNGQQFQLGRRVVERTRLNGLVPREFGLKNIVAIGCGSYHSFAKDKDGRVFAWGLNQFGQCGITMQELGEDGAVIAVPTLIDGLAGMDIKQITGGEHHSAAITTDGALLVWGRLDACQLGLKRDALPSTAVSDASGKPRYIPTPTPLVFDGTTKAAHIACGTHHNILVDEQGHAWSWGFGESYQVGQGPPGEDVEVPTRIVNTATEGKQMCLAGAGGQFSLLCALRQP